MFNVPNTQFTPNNRADFIRWYVHGHAHEATLDMIIEQAIKVWEASVEEAS
jgi:hypothetical protein